MRIGQTSFVVFVSKLVGSALGFLATIYFARELGAEVLGYYALVMALVAWLTLAGHLGVSSAATKRISEGREPAAYLAAGAIMVASLGAVLAAGVYAFGGYVDAYVGQPVVAFVVVILLVRLFYKFVKACLEGERRVHLAGILEPIQIGTYSLVQVALVFVGYGLTGLLVGYVAGGVLIGLIGLVLLSVGVARPGWRHVRSLVEYARYSWLGKLQSRSFNDVDVVVLGLFVPSAMVGVYAVAWSIAKFLTLFDDAVSKSVFPEISRADADGGTDAVSSLVTDSVAFGGLFLVPGLVGSALVADRLLAIYGPEFVQGATILWVLVLATLVYGYLKQLLTALNAIDRPDVAFRVNVVFVASNVVLNVVLISAYGTIGAAVATALAAGVGLSLAFVALRSLVSFAVPFGEIGRQVAAAAVMGGVVYAARLAVESAGVDHNLGIVLGLVALGAGCYFLALWGVSSRFRSTVAANAPVDVPTILFRSQ